VFSKVYVPFYGPAVLQQQSGSLIDTPDPFADTFDQRHPHQNMQAIQ